MFAEGISLTKCTRIHNLRGANNTLTLGGAATGYYGGIGVLVSRFY